MSPQARSELFYLPRADVARALSHIDPVAVATDVLKAHARGETDVPDEGYLGWTTPQGHSARSLNMPGLIRGLEPVAGTKIINASLGNTARGVPRADGLTFLFDPETAHPYAMMDAALISATRTAAVSAVAVGLRTRPAHRLAFLGCGAQADAHFGLLLPRLAGLTELTVYDRDPAGADAFLARHRTTAEAAGVRLTVAGAAEDAVRGSDVVVPLTTVTEGYIRSDWLLPTATVVHVSLDDLVAEVVLGAAQVVVDDWQLVRTDPRRLLGRMYREGLLYGQDEPAPPGPAKQVDGTLGELLLKQEPLDESGLTVVNPFGMSVQDVALAHRVFTAATELGLGSRLPR
ncbi:ornithine cyclodeaminase [Streptomyces sp. NBC_00239]|uniref:ornithine cyclodeaminase n=1 Tax=Streptomyces sp. NBC_00239 TaxID=2903640 RepID=UPI002E2E64A2|nr:ornithine cyclodeaminase [Streptomyces sp. NBC_00239]